MREPEKSEDRFQKYSTGKITLKKRYGKDEKLNIMISPSKRRRNKGGQLPSSDQSFSKVQKMKISKRANNDYGEDRITMS